MRTQSKKLLFAHWTPDQSQAALWCSYPFLYAAAADLSAGGVRSLLFRLVQASLLKKNQRNGQVYFELTEMGRQQLVIDYPVCRPKSRKQGIQWVFCLVMSSTARDKDYRELRQRLEAHGFYHLNRGIFASPDEVSEELRNYLTRKYGFSLLLVKGNDVLVGDVSAFLEKKIVGGDIDASFSSVSSEIGRLLDKLKYKKSIDDQLKNHIFSTFTMVEESAAQLSVLSRLFPKKRAEFLKMHQQWQECVRKLHSLPGTV